MANRSRIDGSTLTAFDVHVHLEHTGDASATDAQATTGKHAGSASLAQCLIARAFARA